MTNEAVEYWRQFWDFRISNTLEDCSNCKNHYPYNCLFGCWTAEYGIENIDIENIDNYICEAYE